jgi:hypothetical protein
MILVFQVFSVLFLLHIIPLKWLWQDISKLRFLLLFFSRWILIINKKQYIYIKLAVQSREFIDYWKFSASRYSAYNPGEAAVPLNLILCGHLWQRCWGARRLLRLPLEVNIDNSHSRQALGSRLESPCNWPLNPNLSDESRKQRLVVKIWHTVLTPFESTLNRKYQKVAEHIFLFSEIYLCLLLIGMSIASPIYNIMLKMPSNLWSTVHILTPKEVIDSKSPSSQAVSLIIVAPIKIKSCVTDWTCAWIPIQII